MKKILGIVALTMIMGLPAFGQNNSVVTYVLQVGGSNAGGPTVPYDTSTVVEPTDPILVVNGDIINWSVRVTASGDVGGQLIGGAANLVWDLQLKDPSNAVPSATFGLGSASTPGFYSTIMNGSPGFQVQPASFTWVYGAAAPFGRLIDASGTANGMGMLQFTYPSTYQYYLAPTASTPLTTTVGAAAGTQMGMGAGYQDLADTVNTERTGVGILAPGTAGYTCYMDIGAKAPMAEGQINLAGLPNGTWTLVLTPGLGNNVVSTALCDLGTTGAFASAAGTTNGSTIQFVHNGVSAPAPNLLPNVASVKLHGGVAYGIPFIGDSVTNPGGPTTLSVECRNGVTQIALPFDVPVEAADGTLDTEIAVTGGTIGSLDTTTPGLILVNMTTTNVNGSCVTVTVSGLRKAGGGQTMPAPVTKAIVALRGDVTGNNAVDIGDVNAVKAASGAVLSANASNFRRDTTANGAIDIGDVNNVKSLSGGGFVGTCP